MGTHSEQHPDIPLITLHDGTRIPQIGLGVLRIDDEGVVPVVESALEVGYRHIDGAAGYNNEEGVGRALAATGYNTGEQRASLWMTTKLRDSEQGYDSAMRAFDRSLELLQLDYVDMYMIHWPTPFDWRSGETWKALRELREDGRVRTLGVCNFMPEHLDRLFDKTGSTRPSTRSNCTPHGSNVTSSRTAAPTVSRWRRIRRWRAAPTLRTASSSASPPRTA